MVRCLRYANHYPSSVGLPTSAWSVERTESDGRGTTMRPPPTYRQRGPGRRAGKTWTQPGKHPTVGADSEPRIPAGGSVRSADRALATTRPKDQEGRSTPGHQRPRRTPARYSLSRPLRTAGGRRADAAACRRRACAVSVRYHRGLGSRARRRPAYPRGHELGACPIVDRRGTRGLAVPRTDDHGDGRAPADAD